MAKPTEITSEQLRRAVGETLKRVAYGREAFLVTLHGKPVARLEPIDEDKATKAKKPRD